METTTSKFARGYDREFKENAVALVRSGKTITDVARDLGVSHWSLTHWAQLAASGHPRQKRRWRPRTTQCNPCLPVAENWLAKMLEPERPDQIWVADITYIETKEGWLYLAGIMDVFCRKIVGWNTACDLSTPLVTGAWQKAWKNRRPRPGLLHHSDRGSQYASNVFRALLENHGVTASMSRRANCYDNATMESFWASLKTECFGSFIPQSRHHAHLMIFDYIEAFYNRSRLHSSIGYKSPLEYESSLPYPLN